MQSGIFDLQAELTRKEGQVAAQQAQNQSGKGNKTFSKIGAITGKKKKRKDKSEKTSAKPEKFIDDESAQLYAQAKAKLAAKTKLYDKMNSGEIGDAENVFGETKFLVDFHRKYEDGQKNDEKSDENSDLEEEASSSKIIFEIDEEHRDRMREKWEQEQKDILDAPVHYENVKFDEIRTLGTGYFAFSKDEETRQRQLDELKKMRQNTKNVHDKKDALKLKRKAAVQARLNKIKQKKGLPIEDETSKQTGEKETELDTNNSTNSEHDLNSISSIKNSCKSSVSVQNEIKSPADTNIIETQPSASSCAIDDMIKECREQSKSFATAREWDVGKGERSIKQQFVSSSSSNVGRKKDLAATYEEKIKSRRNERDTEFAPPKLY